MLHWAHQIFSLRDCPSTMTSLLPRVALLNSTASHILYCLERCAPSVYCLWAPCLSASKQHCVWEWLCLLKENNNVDFRWITTKFLCARHQLLVPAPPLQVSHQPQHPQGLPLLCLLQHHSIMEQTQYEESICTCLLFSRRDLRHTHRCGRGGWLVLEVTSQILKRS